MNPREPFAVGGVVVIDVPPDQSDYRAVQSASYAPPGAEVVFRVEREQFPPHGAIQWLRCNGSHLAAVSVWCSCPATVDRWVAALRGADVLGVVA